MDRKGADDNFSHKQPICYSIIYNPDTQQIFAFQRSGEDEDYPEKRLQGKWSCGIGGHINETDAEQGDPISKSRVREILEEVEIEGSKGIIFLGYINDDSDNVGKVHFAILYLIVTDSNKVTPLDPEIEEGGLVPLDVFEKKCRAKDSNVENWSKIAFQALKEYLKE